MMQKKRQTETLAQVDFCDMNLPYFFISFDCLFDLILNKTIKYSLTQVFYNINYSYSRTAG